MKTIRIFEIRSFILAAIFSGGLGFVSSAFGFGTEVIVNPDGKLISIDTLRGYYSSSATAINDSGQVAGTSVTGEGFTHAFTTGPNGVGMTDLGTLDGNSSYAFGINTTGQVVGRFYNIDGSLQRAFMTGPNGAGMTDLGIQGTATAINDSGQVVGTSATGYNTVHAFITGPNGVGMTNLGTLGGTYSDASGVNDSGQVVGFSTTEDGSPHAFITAPNGAGMTDLGTLGGYSSHATGVNDSGQVVGFSQTGDNSVHAFITGPNGVGMTDLGTLGGNSSYAVDINDAGEVVGFSDRAWGTFHAFITGPNGVGIIDFNSYADLPDRHYLSSASGINNLGQVIATLAPIPEPASYALMLAGLGLVGFMARRKKPAENMVECR